MLEWVSLLPTVFVAAVVVLVPGVPVAVVLRLRGLSFFAGAVAASLALTAVASVITPWLGLAWSFWMPLVLGAVIAGGCALLPRPKGQDSEEPFWRSLLQPTVTLALAALVISVTLVQGIGSPGAISQTYDNVFHLNAAAAILENGSASPFHMSMFAPEATGLTFYPTSWHALAALIVQLTGASLPAAFNALTLVVAAAIWPVGMLFFATQFISSRWVSWLGTALLTFGFSAFPFMLIRWGVLYPNFLATALIPIALGFIHALLRPQILPQLTTSAKWLGAIGATGAATLAHPTAYFAIVALALPLAVAHGPAVIRSCSSALTKLCSAVLLVLPFAIGLYGWITITSGDNKRTFEGSIPSAFFSALLNAPLIDVRAWFITALVLGGVLVVLFWGRGNRWLLGSYAVAIALYTISSGAPDAIRTPITGLWYNDAHRLAALLPIIALPLAAIVVDRGLTTFERGLRLSSSTSTMRERITAYGSIALVLLLLALSLRGPSITRSIDHLRDVFSFEEQSELLTPDEVELFEDLVDIVPEDAVIAGNPWNGSGLAFAFSGREVLFPHLNGVYSPDAWLVAQELKEGTPEACAAAERLGVDFVLDLGTNYQAGRNAGTLKYPGITNVEDSPVFTEVDARGEATLYRVSGCTPEVAL